MKPRALFAAIGICLFLVTAVAAREIAPVANDRYGDPLRTELIHGGAGLAKTAGDTVALMGPTGSGAPYLGDFEAGWNGWVSEDLTRFTEFHWNISDYGQTGGNLVAWCGDLGFPSCGGDDPEGGYGNGWNDLLAFRATVADPSSPADVNLTATLAYDVESEYDFARVGYYKKDDYAPNYVASWTGQGVVAVNETIAYLPGEYWQDTDIFVVFNVRSDGAFSDADCFRPSAGACTVDDVTVTVTQSGQADIIIFEDFQDGGTFAVETPTFLPPTLEWYITVPSGVGDFAQLWTDLDEIDPCADNFSQQVAFIDDGLVVPGTGGTECISWCYGPNGYIVNNTGGLVGNTSFLRNYINSPVMELPPGDGQGLVLEFDAFIHTVQAFQAPTIYTDWSIRSADTDNSAGNGVQDITEQPYGLFLPFIFRDGVYERIRDDMSDLLVPGADQVQVRLGVYQQSVTVFGNDGTPAPYLDNVSVKVYPAAGPVMTASAQHLAQDNFPEIDAVEFGDLGAQHVRFDMARNIAPRNDLWNDPGDSIVATVYARREGATLVGPPELHYTIDANPVYDAYRTTATSGSVPGVPARLGGGAVIADRWAFDLADSGTLFPGDVLHYYLQATDDVAGDMRTSTLPGDLSGYGAFEGPLAYNPRFMVHALPSIRDDGSGGYRAPPILFWDDSGDPDLAARRYELLTILGAVRGFDFDFYYTNAPSAGVSNGIGGRTDGTSLGLYSDIVYAAGDQDDDTITRVDTSYDVGDDIGALLAWLDQGERGLFISGDGVATDLASNQGMEGTQFLTQVMGLSYGFAEIRPFIGNQRSPLVRAVPGNPVFQSETSWYAVGSCPDLRAFDGVEAVATAQRLAEFTDPSQNPGAYSYAAATLNAYGADNDKIVSMPYDLMAVAHPGNKVGSAYSLFPALVLGEILAFFNHGWGPYPPVPEADRFAIGCYPNPFNPATRVSYTIAAPGHLSLKIYDVRGALVRTLIDEQVQVSGHVMWDGTDGHGARVSSGLYFSEARMGKEVLVQKMTLVK
jgi:hypothetical protein